MKTTMMTILPAVLIVILIGQPSTAQPPQTITLCVVDVVFCIDNSGSIGDTNPPGGDNWGLILNFVQALVNLFNVAADQTHVGCVDFGNEGYVEFSMLNYTTAASVNSVIKALRYRGENTNTTGGLYWARQLLTNPIYGSRPNVPKVIILITDGKPTRDEDILQNEVVIIKSLGIRIVSVGITNQINETLLQSIATSPADYVYGGNYNQLNQVVNVVINNQTCLPVLITTTTTTTPLPTPPNIIKGCATNFDVVFILDSSNGVSYANFQTMKNFVINVILNFDLENLKVRVGIVTFSDTAVSTIFLNTFTARLQLANAVTALPFLNGNTRNTSGAFAYTRTIMFTAANGDRANTPNICVYISNGGSTNPADTQTQATLLKNANVLVITVAIGTWLGPYEFQNMASFPYQTNFLWATTGFPGLNVSTTAALGSLVCYNANGCSSNPCNNKLCNTPPSQCDCSNANAGVQCEISCRVTSDIVFLLDASSIYGQTNFQNQLNFVRTLVSSLPLLGGGTRVSVIFYSTTVTVQFTLVQFSNKLNILDGISTSYQGGTRNTAAGLAALTQELTSNGRPNIAKIGIVMTAGPSDNMTATAQQASLARQAGITLLVIAVGPRALQSTEMAAIATNPTSANIFNVTDFNSFNITLQSVLITTLCDEINECNSNPCQQGGKCNDLIQSFTCSCPSGFTGNNCERACSGRVDVSFIIDASGSVRIERFPKVLDFVVSVIDQLTVGPNQTQIAALTYSDNPVLQFLLNTYNNKEDVQLAIRRMQFIDGRTNSADAIALMTNTIYNRANGDRPDAPNVCFILSNGNDNINTLNTIPNAILARSKGIYIVAFAVGTDVSTFELRNIASEPYNQTIFTVASAANFSTILNSLVNAACDPGNECGSSPCQNGGTCVQTFQMFQCNCPQPFSGETCARRCPVQLDVIFVLDLSGSLEEVYNLVIEMAKQTIYGLPVGQNLVRVSVLTFSDTPTIVFDLNAYQTPASVRNALRFSKSGGTTNTQAAIQLAQTVFTQVTGDRSGVQNVMIVITDGMSNVQQQNTIPQANNARSQNIEIYAVGVGPDVNPPEIVGIASVPTTGHVVYVNQTSAVSAGVGQLLNLLCQQ